MADEGELGTELTASIVSAYVANNSVPASELPDLIASVHAAFGKLRAQGQQIYEQTALQPAVPIKKSVTAEYLICLDDGIRLKSLKRHLTGLGMTPDEYRAKWNLPKDYPMVAANYAAKRAEIAKSLGLGRKNRPAKDAVEPKPAGKRGRPRKNAAS